MRAERAAAKMDRDYEKFARRLAEEKNRLDIALRREAIRRAALTEGMEKGMEKGRNEERQHFLEMLDQGLSVEEIKRQLNMK